MTDTHRLHPTDALAVAQRIRRKADTMVTDATIAGRPNLRMHSEEIRALADILIRHMEHDT